MKNFSINVERSLLGGLLNASKNFYKYADFANEDFFYDSKNKLAYKTLLSLANANSNQGVQAPVLIDALHIKDPKQDWHSYISLAIAEGCPEVMIIPYAKKLDDLYSMRKLGATLHSLSSEVDESSEANLMDVIGNVEAKLFELIQGDQHRDFRKVGAIASQALDNVKRRINEEDLLGIKTDFKMLDSLTGGLQKSDLIILAARPSMGKTAFALNIAKNVAKTKSVGFVSLEMSSEQLSQRLLSTFAFVDLNKMKNPSSLDATDWNKLHTAHDIIDKLKLYIDDTPGITISELMWKIRKFARNRKLDLLIIDYLQLINVKNSSSIENRQAEVAVISRSLKFLAKELNIPIIALSQLSRRVEQRENKRPMMSDLRESGAIEQDADIVMFLYRDEYYTRDAVSDDEYDEPVSSIQDMPHESEVIIAKHRNGPIGNFSLLFRSSIGLFSNFKKGD